MDKCSSGKKRYEYIFRALLNYNGQQDDGCEWDTTVWRRTHESPQRPKLCLPTHKNDGRVYVRILVGNMKPTGTFRCLRVLRKTMASWQKVWFASKFYEYELSLCTINNSVFKTLYKRYDNEERFINSEEYSLIKVKRLRLVHPNEIKEQF